MVGERAWQTPHDQNGFHITNAACVLSNPRRSSKFGAGLADTMGCGRYKLNFRTFWPAPNGSTAQGADALFLACIRWRSVRQSGWQRDFYLHGNQTAPSITAIRP